MTDDATPVFDIHQGSHGGVGTHHVRDLVFTVAHYTLVHVAACLISLHPRPFRSINRQDPCGFTTSSQTLRMFSVEEHAFVTANVRSRILVPRHVPNRGRSQLECAALRLERDKFDSLSGCLCCVWTNILPMAQ